MSERTTTGKGFYRYMSWAEAIRATGFLRGKRPGETYWTDEWYESAEEAKQLLALKVRPGVRIEFRILNESELLRDGDRVEPGEDEPGGGTEWMTLEPVEVEVIEVEPLD